MSDVLVLDSGHGSCLLFRVLEHNMLLEFHCVCTSIISLCHGSQSSCFFNMAAVVVLKWKKKPCISSTQGCARLFTLRPFWHAKLMVCVRHGMWGTPCASCTAMNMLAALFITIGCACSNLCDLSMAHVCKTYPLRQKSSLIAWAVMVMKLWITFDVHQSVVTAMTVAFVSSYNSSMPFWVTCVHDGAMYLGSVEETICQALCFSYWVRSRIWSIEHCDRTCDGLSTSWCGRQSRIKGRYSIRLTRCCYTLPGFVCKCATYSHFLTGNPMGGMKGYWWMMSWHVGCHNWCGLFEYFMEMKYVQHIDFDLSSLTKPNGSKRPTSKR